MTASTNPARVLIKSLLSQDAGEGLRKNVNSFADNLLGGTKTHSSTGIHPDAKKAGNDLEEGVKDAGKKLDKMADKHKR